MADQHNDDQKKRGTTGSPGSQTTAAPDGNSDPSRRDERAMERERQNQDDPSRAPESGDRK